MILFFDVIMKTLPDNLLLEWIRIVGEQAIINDMKL
jgi:hypothetical protein